jgi:glycosyltransferase involved in cell wall biosynthesis
LDAVKELTMTNPKVRLVILGEGDQRGLLEAQVKRLGIEERVLMPGYVANAGQYLPLFQIFALSSLTEGLPIVILEAMQARVPIVATRVGGVPEVLGMGKAGILVTPNSCDSLVHGISEIINNPEKAGQRVHTALQRLHDHYSCHSMAEKYLELYQSLVQ